MKPSKHLCSAAANCLFSLSLGFSIAVPSKGSSVPPRRPRLSPKPWGEEPGDTIANKVPPATLSTQRLFPEQCKRVFISHQDLTLVDRNSYFNSHLETFPTFSISSASYPPTSSTSLSGKAGSPPWLLDPPLLPHHLLHQGQKLPKS